MAQINLLTTITQNKNILASTMDHEIVMMNISTGKYYNLGKTGSVIWDNLDQPMQVGTLIEKLVNRYDVSKDKCIQDTIPFLEHILDQGLLQIEDI